MVVLLDGELTVQNCLKNNTMYSFCAKTQGKMYEGFVIFCHMQDFALRHS